MEIVAGLPCVPRTIGGYWPIKGEINLSELMRCFAATGIGLALPVVVEQAAPLDFWRWFPGMKLDRRVWNIPVPSLCDPVKPDVILVPLVGYDDDCFRLGNGGGYYDRTIAVMSPKPLVIGVGYGFSRMVTIYPQRHDIPMDVIVTEEGRIWRNGAPSGQLKDARDDVELSPSS